MASIAPTRESLENLKQTVPTDKPVTMLNLLRFNEQAIYPADSTHASCSGAAFFELIGMPDYQAATVHRTAALADSRLIATVESGDKD